MSNLFTILPFAVPNNSLPIIPESDFDRFSEVEFQAYEHWIFDQGASSLVGLLNGRPLTAQSTAPSYLSTYLTIDGGEGKALLTDMGESAGQEDTIAVVFKHNSADTTVVFPFGSLGKNTDPAPVSGGGPFIANAGPDLLLTYRGTALSSTDTTDNVAAGQWVFMCISRKMAATGALNFLLGGSANRSYSGNYSAYIPAASGRKIGLGAPYYNAIAGKTLSFAEAVLFDRALSAAEMGALYNRAKSRMAARGITIA